MVRIDYAARYFMPLISSSNPYVKAHCVFAIILLYTALSMSYGFVGKPIDAPHLFLPNAQDYFRASLLGVLSPMLYYFVQTLLINSNKRCLTINFLLDFYLDDWFILLIIVCLAYPQQQQQENRKDLLWHIIPRQTYVFGIAWSLGELIVSVFDNLFIFREIPLEVETFQEQSFGKGNGAVNADDITLSKCLDVRRDSSSISNNVYYSENEAQKGYDSLSDGTASDPVLLINPSDNSLKLTSLEYERETKLFNQRRNLGYLTDARESTQSTNQSLTRTFKAFKPNWSLFKSLCIMLIAIFSNVALIVGQCLISSIYFTYVPGYDRFFTPTVNYFGHRGITLFLIVIFLPFTIIDLLINALIHACKYFDGCFSHKIKDSDYYDYYNSELSLQASAPTTASWVPPISLILSNPSLGQRDSIHTHESRILYPLKKAIRSWHNLAKSDWLILSSMAVWGIGVFIMGFIATVP